MTRSSAAFSFALLAVFLAACAGPDAKVDMNRESVSRIQSIAVILPPEPKTYTVTNLGHPGMSFGLIGGLIAAADESEKGDRFSRAMQSERLSVLAALSSSVEQKLIAAGYQARVEEGPWAEDNGRYRVQIDKLRSEADAVLVISPAIVGYVSQNSFADYLPTITVDVTLLDKDRRTQLYRGFHATGWKPIGENWRHSPPTKTFATFDALMAQPSESASALTRGAATLSASIAEDLGRK